MMKNNMMIFLLLMCMTSTASAQGLDDFIRMALNYHPELKADSVQQEKLSEEKNQISSFMDPMLNAGYNVLPQGMERAEVSLMQNFEWFGTSASRRAAAEADIQSNRYQLEAKKKRTETDVSNLYYDIMENEEITRVQHDVLNSYLTLKELADNKLSTTRGSMVDVIRAEMAVDELKTQIELQQQKLKALVFSINKLVGRVEDAPVVTTLASSVAIGRENPLENHPEIKALDFRLNADREKTAVAKKESLPVLGVGVTYMKMISMGSELMPMVSASLPVFRKKYKAKIRTQQLQEKADQYEREWALNRLTTERNDIKTRWEMAAREIDLYKEQVKKIRQSTDLLLSYYSTTGADLQEVIRSQNEELRYQMMEAQKRIEILKLSKQWDYLNNN